MEYLQARVLEGRSERVVRVLVDDDHAEVLVRLELEGGEQVVELADAADRRDDEVERRKLSATRTVGYDRSVPPAPLVSVLLAVSNGERYLRAALESILRQTISGLRAARRRRRLDGRNSRDPRGHRGRRGFACFVNDGSAGSRSVAQPRPGGSSRTVRRTARRRRRRVPERLESSSSAWCRARPSPSWEAR